MAEAILVVFSFAPIVQVPPEVFDTAHDLSLGLYTGIQSPNRDLRLGFEVGARVEYVIAHPYILRFGVDYSEANVTDPFAPRGDKNSVNLSADALVYRGRDGVISYLGFGLAFGVNSIDVAQSALDSLNSSLGVTDVSLDNKFGYRVLLGLRFEERFVFEMSFQQANPNYVYRRDFGGNTHSLENIDGTFSVARMSLGYLIKL